MHCHTKEGSIDGTLPLLDNIEILKSKGYHGMMITDHDSYKAYTYWENLNQKPDFTVIRGLEYDTINGGHILVVLPTGVRPHIMDLRGMPVSFLIDVVHYYGGICGPAHPYGEKFMSLLSTRYGKKHSNLFKRFDFVEGFNACEDIVSNEKAHLLAQTYHLPVIGGSDSHRMDCAGLGYTELEEDIQNEDELINYIKAHRSTKAEGEFYTRTTKQKIGQLNKVLVYSFWPYNRVSGYLKAFHRHYEMHKTDLKNGLKEKQKMDAQRHYINLR